jgi:two-component system, OmpR family, phosphate regulon response regulator OmpR
MNNAPPLIPHILVVDDDGRLRDLLARYLGEHGWLITTAKHAADARVKLAYFTVDLIVLDGMMPKESGIQFAESLRKEPNPPPILMLTAMGEAHQRIAGLEAGVEDYLTKPFEPRELLLRLQRILSRTMPKIDPTPALIRFGAFQLDALARRLTHADTPVHLTESEMNLLLVLAAYLNQPVSRERLSEAVAGEEEPNPRSADVIVTRLRKKIEAEPARPLYLQTVRGEGYALRS